MTDFLQVKHPNPEYFCYSNALQVHLSEAAVRENAWLGSITTSAPEDSLFNSFPTVMFLSADSKVSRDEWMDKFNELIALGEYDKETAAAAAMSSQRQKKSSHRLPMLPPRKRF